MAKIYATIGPSCSDYDTLYHMFKNGMTGIRLNLNHSSLSESKKIISNINSAANALKITPEFIIDLQGKNIRTKHILFPIDAKENDIVNITTHPVSKNDINVPDIILNSASIGDIISINDGHVSLKILDKSYENLKAKVLQGGTIDTNMSISCIDSSNLLSRIPLFTTKDLKNIKLASKYNVTGIMQPFVQHKDDVLKLKRVLKSNKLDNIKIFTKIENQNGVNNLEEIMKESDEIVIARGDLGNSIGITQIPQIQKEIADRCKSKNKDFMIVTELLSSMIDKPYPTRAEVNDIYNSLFDGATSLMVTNETAIGKYPIKVIEMLKQFC